MTVGRRLQRSSSLGPVHSAAEYRAGAFRSFRARGRCESPAAFVCALWVLAWVSAWVSAWIAGPSSFAPRLRSHGAAVHGRESEAQARCAEDLAAVAQDVRHRISRPRRRWARRRQDIRLTRDTARRGKVGASVPGWAPQHRTLTTSWRCGANPWIRLALATRRARRRTPACASA